MMANLTVRMNNPRCRMDGWINLYKPLNMTSAQAVAAIKRLSKVRKVGHAGTLDPLAEGVLPIALGEATKTAAYMVDAGKEYAFTLCFGESRATDDREGEVTARSDVRPDESSIRAVLSEFTGNIAQVPPAYSAIKVAGKRAYALARSGEDVVLKPREVQITSLHLERMIDENNAYFTVCCGKGTYIRSLARDIAIRLGSVGYVADLKRLRVGKFTCGDAISLDFLEKLVHNPDSAGASAWADVLMPLSTALVDIPAITVDEVQEARLRSGLPVVVGELLSEGELVAAMIGNKLVAVCTRHGALLKPKRVFNV